MDGKVPYFSLFFAWKRSDTQRPEVTGPSAWGHHTGDVVHALKCLCVILGIGTDSTLRLYSFVGFTSIMLGLMPCFDISQSLPSTHSHPGNISSWKSHSNEAFCFRQNDSHQLQEWIVYSNALCWKVKQLVIKEQILMIVSDSFLICSGPSHWWGIWGHSQNALRKGVLEETDSPVEKLRRQD